MTSWHTSYDLRLAPEKGPEKAAEKASGLTALAAAKTLRLEANASQDANALGSGLVYRGRLDSSG